MRLLLQRVQAASVSVAGDTIGAIDQGLCIFICAMAGDDENVARLMAAKVAKCRLFTDVEGRTNLSLLDVGGAALVVSQFTLSAQWKKGNRPGFCRAADPETGKRLYKVFATSLAEEGVLVATGQFAASMQISLLNDGPFTLWMDSQNPE